jgi:DNA-binding transcriptional MerR regulator
VSAVAGEQRLRIGEVAERTGTTPRTIRYSEELGQLPGGQQRVKGKHLLYTESDVERLAELKRLRDLLGLSLEELKRVVEAEDARAELRRRFEETVSTAERLRIVEQALPNVELQLELVRRRQDELRELEADLVDRRKRLLRRRRELGADSG